MEEENEEEDEEETEEEEEEEENEEETEEESSESQQIENVRNQMKIIRQGWSSQLGKIFWTSMPNHFHTDRSCYVCI